MTQYTQEELITEALAKKAQPVTVDNDSNAEQLLLNLDQLHTTDLGNDRIRRNLHLGVDDVVSWCREKIQSPDSQIRRRGKNWYIAVDGCEITVNAHSYTIITAHTFPSVTP